MQTYILMTKLAPEMSKQVKDQAKIGRLWLDQVKEEAIAPDREIVDPHHHRWERPRSTYVLEHLWADTESGHTVATVFRQLASRAGATPRDGST